MKRTSLNRPRMKLLLDSGAFSAWSVGKQIPITKYYQCLEERAHRLALAVNLDVIPGRKGQPATAAQREEAAKASWDNYQVLRKVPGVTVIPVYHYGERPYWLHKIIAEGPGYIGLGGVARLKDEVRVKWLDNCFMLICHGGLPDVKVHGFGVTSVHLMLEYPWESVDSISWKVRAINGKVIVPPLGWDGKPAYRKSALTFKATPGRAKGGTPSIGMLGPGEQAYLQRFFEAQGFTMEDVCHPKDHSARLRSAYRVYQEQAALYEQRPFPAKAATLFDRNVIRDKPSKHKLIVYYGDGAKPDTSLNVEGCRNRLLSYESLGTTDPIKRLDAYLDAAEEALA